MDDIIKWCNEMEINNFFIVDGKINVNGNVSLSRKQLTCIPYPFGIIRGSFICNSNIIGDPMRSHLDNHINFPTEVYGDVHINGNKIKSLEYLNILIHGNLVAMGNMISTYGKNVIVDGDINVCGNKLTSFYRFPKECNGNLLISSNELTSLEDCPRKIKGGLLIKRNKIKSFNGIGEVMGQILCDNNLKEDRFYLLHEAKRKLLYG